MITPHQPVGCGKDGEALAQAKHLAGTGLRCGEAYGLHVEDLDLAGSKVCVRRSIWNGEEVSPKTKKGYRVVNIEPVLVEMLTSHLGERKVGRVFQTRNGTPFCKSNVRRKLNQILKSVTESAASRATRISSWSRLRAASERRSGRSGKGDVARKLPVSPNCPNFDVFAVSA